MRDRRTAGFIELGLIVTCVVLFIATGLLYASQARQRALLTATVRSSGWVAYQAQLEFVKAEAAFAKVSTVPTAKGVDELLLRMEILRSRLPILYDSDEGRVLSDVVDTRGLTRPMEALLDEVIAEAEALDPEDGETGHRLEALNRRLQPLGQTLQRILMESVAYNQEIFRRERALAESPEVVSLLLLFITGGILVLLLLLQGRRDRARLREIEEAQAAIKAMEANLRAVIQAVPACVAVVDPDTGHPTFINSNAAALVAATPDDPAWPGFVRAVRDAAGEPVGGSWGMLTMSYTRPGGDIVSLRGSICSLMWQQRPQHLIVLADTTRVRSAELQVMQAAKLATLGEMATAIAHELNQPLAVIRMAAANARRLLDPLPGGEAATAKLDRISAQVDRAKRITDQVRRYGRMPSEQMQPFSLRHAVDLAVGFIADQYQAANIRLTIDAGVPMEALVLGEQTMFEQVLESRLEPIIQSAGLSGMGQLVGALREGREAGLVSAVVEAMTTNESLFFRDKRPFDLFISLMLPQLLARRPASQPLRIWCAAASTGQEPYSLAMLLKENERLLAGRRVDIVGTDLSSEVIARAREGVYNQFEVQRGLPVHYLLRYFTQDGQNWRVSDTIRSMVRFSTLNLLQSFGHLGSFDIVFCRNVLIYFDAATKTDVLSRIARVMARDGYLVLGGAESVLGLESPFVPGSQQGFYILRD